MDARHTKTGIPMHFKKPVTKTRNIDILNQDIDDFRITGKQLAKRPGAKQENYGNDTAEYQSKLHGAFSNGPDSIKTPRTIILRDKWH